MVQLLKYKRTLATLDLMVTRKRKSLGTFLIRAQSNEYTCSNYDKRVHTAIIFKTFVYKNG